MRFRALLLPLLMLPLAQGSAEDACAALRAGQAARALQLLGESQGEQADFLRGRALIALGRPEQAIVPLQRIAPEHPLFPYAAKALLYCAWQSTSVDPDRVLPPLLSSGNEEIALMAAAALAEYRLDRDDATAKDILRELGQQAEQHEELRPLLQLLEIADLRRDGDFDTAITRCRRLERDRTLTLATRHRLRLLLAEVYYAQEQAAQSEAPAPAAEEDDEDELLPADAAETPVAHGRGEETLLHFISSSPESPLLDEAFRRLMKHEAFSTSEAARSRLKEWSNDMRYPHRMALALHIQQQLLTPEDALEVPPDATGVNTASAALPREARTDAMLLEHVRRLLQRGMTTEAALYLAGVQQNSARRDFLAASLITDAAKAAHEFIAIARRADGVLQAPAWHNAMLRALQAQNHEAVESILQEPDLPQPLRQELLALAASYEAEPAPAAALQKLRLLEKEELPPALRTDVRADIAYLHLEHPELFESGSLSDILPDLHTDADISEEQYLRLTALGEKLLSAEGHDEEAISLIARAAEQCPTAHGKAVLSLHYAHVLSNRRRHRAALAVLQNFLSAHPKDDLVPRARMLAARQAELIGTLDSLRTAAELYGQCAEQADAGAARAAIRQAAVLLRIGQQADAERILNALQRREETLSAQDKVLVYAVMANLQALQGTEDSLQAAVHTASEMLAEPALPPRWQALTLLHHGMICTRAGKHDLALGDYLAVLRMKPAHTATLSTQDWRTLYQAAAGAAYEYMNCGRFEEAARMAESAAAWQPEEECALQDISARFTRWAQNLRKTHFLPAAKK